MKGPDRTVRVTVVIVTFNSESVIGDCLKALVSDTCVGDGFLEIVVVDNASRDNTLAVVEEISPAARIVRNETNVGFAKAVNGAVAMARGEYILLLNPDATFSAQGVTKLVAGMQREGVGAVAPLIVHPSGRLRIVSAGYLPTTWRMFCHYSGLSRLGRAVPLVRGHYLLADQLRPVTSVEWVTGACVMVRASLWSSLGGLSERWFMYAEDIEFCHRIRQQHLSIDLLRDVEAQHMVGGSQGSETVSLNPAWIVNLYDFFDRSLRHSKLDSALWRLTVMLGLWSRSVAYGLRARKASASPESAAWAAEAKRFRIFAKSLHRLPMGGTAK